MGRNVQLSSWIRSLIKCSIFINFLHATVSGKTIGHYKAGNSATELYTPTSSAPSNADQFSEARRQVPPEWQCPGSYYGTNDGCDCECGAVDPDCSLNDQQLYGCLSGFFNAFCSSEGLCEYTPTAQWVCEPEKYGGKDGCDCNCGSQDPDCSDSNQIVLGCDNYTAPQCVAGTCNGSEVVPDPSEECTDDFCKIRHFLPFLLCAVSVFIIIGCVGSSLCSVEAKDSKPESVDAQYFKEGENREEGILIPVESEHIIETATALPTPVNSADENVEVEVARAYI